MHYGIALAALLSGAVSAQDYSTVNLVDVDITTAPNNTLFTRWRPTSHFMGPHSWMNDPCAPSYDPETGLYHMMYQWHPHHINWGNISWGHAVSKDQVTWTDIGGWQNSAAQALSTGPNGTLDHLGVFSGSAQFLPANQSYGLPGYNFTAGPTNETIMVVFYTAVQHLPTNWAIPYINSTETQVLAVSTDGGLTFDKLQGKAVNPVIPQPPPGWNITGFRDPIYGKWAEMDDILGNATAGNFYTVFGSGIKGVGPRLPLYYAPADDITTWHYLGPIFGASLNQSWSETYSGTFGYNFEVAGAFSLTETKEGGGDGETAHHYVIMGSEGGNTTKHPSAQWALWSEVAITRSANGGVESNILASGVLDWGISYAWNSFWDAPKKRRIAYGWAKEEDLTVAKTAQGWQGVLTLPRELYVKVYEGVKNTGGMISQRGSWTSQRRSDGTWKVTTLGMQPAQDVVKALRKGAKRVSVEEKTVQANSYTALDANGISVNIHAEIDIPYGSTTPVGFVVRRSPDGEEQTLIIYDPDTQEVSVVREQSSSLNSTYVQTYTHVAPLFLLDSHCGGEVKRETLSLDIFVDNSMIEVFANERVGITSRVYPARIDSTGVGMWVGEGVGGATFKKVTVWTGLKNAFPERPANSSTALVFDTPEETGNYVWWPGN